MKIERSNSRLIPIDGSPQFERWWPLENEEPMWRMSGYLRGLENLKSLRSALDNEIAKVIWEQRAK